MENYDYAKIIVILTNILSKMPIQSPIFSQSWTNHKDQNIS